MIAPQSEKTQTRILERLLQPENGDVNAEAARFFLSLKFSTADHERMTALGAKARAGTLTPEEDEESDSHIRVGDWLAILQSKSRRVGRSGIARIA